MGYGYSTYNSSCTFRAVFGTKSRIDGFGPGIINPFKVQDVIQGGRGYYLKNNRFLLVA